jgi:exosortase F-associated protein
MSKDRLLSPHRNSRIIMIAFAITGLSLTFIFQRIDCSQIFSGITTESGKFIFNRTLRFLLNDNLMLLMIYGLFYNRRYLKFALMVEVFGFCFLLLPYFILRYYTDIDPMYISFIHRLIVNPTLMILLVPALYIQNKSIQK